MKAKVTASLDVTPYLIYCYKFKTVDEIKAVLEKLIDLRIPNNYIAPNKKSNEELKEIYNYIDFNNINKNCDYLKDFLYIINNYYYDNKFCIEVFNNDIVVMPSYPEFWINMSLNDETSIKCLTEIADYSLSRHMIYFMENNNLNYINTELNWHHFIDCKVNQ